jgi:transposase
VGDILVCVWRKVKRGLNGLVGKKLAEVGEGFQGFQKHEFGRRCATGLSSCWGSFHLSRISRTCMRTANNAPSEDSFPHPATRMALRDLRSSLKHRIHAAVDRCGLHTDAISDLFGTKGRQYLASRLSEFPLETARMVEVQLAALDELAAHVEGIEERIRAEIVPAPQVQLLRSVPGVGEILAPVIGLEIGDVRRFPRAENLASYAGLVPRVFSSGGHTRLGGISRFVNQYLKWAFVEAANCAVRLKTYRHSHIGCLYQRLLAKREHGRAIVAVARHLAEASYWILRKQEPYRAPHQNKISSRNG